MMAGFQLSWARASEYPKNLVQSNLYQHRLDAYFELLNQHEDRLFDVEKVAYVQSLELKEWNCGSVNVSRDNDRS